MSKLDIKLDVYRSPAYSCPFDAGHSSSCGSMLLGALMREMQRTCLLLPRLETPYLGRSFDTVCDTVRVMDSGTWYHSIYSHHECRLSTTMISIVDSAIASVEGLGLSER
jgi:hypothetical protein